jgi:cysteine desulfurase/selenocysteine lyase
LKFDVYKIRNDFPILKEKVYGKPLVYIDNAATTQKPISVINCVNDYHRRYNSSIHRSVNALSNKVTEEYEETRKKIQAFIHAQHSHEIIYTSGCTGSINGLAFSFGERYMKEGDEIILTEMEHHANIVPWQMLCDRKKGVLKIVPFNENGELMMEQFDKLITAKTKLISVAYVSNALGTINSVKEIIDKAHKNNIPVLVDGAQAIQHIPVNVQDLDCDFFVFSSHKAYGPTGTGILYGKEKWLNELPPFQGGGEMVDVVTFDKTTYQKSPMKFEAGTPNYIGAIGLGKALDYISSIGLDKINEYEHELLKYATGKLNAVEDIHIIGNAENKSSVISFNIGNIHPYDAGMILDKLGIAVRTGTHCAQTVMQHYKIEGTVRVSFALYNTKEEIDYLCDSLEKVKTMFS